MRKAWLAGLGLLLLPALPAVGDEWTHQYQLKGRPELRVTTDDGSVQIETSDRREIGARVTTRGWRIAPDEVTITETQTGDRVEIEVKVPHERWGMNFGHRDIKVALQVPREADLDIRTGDGSVSVPPVSGNVRQAEAQTSSVSPTRHDVARASSPRVVKAIRLRGGRSSSSEMRGALVFTFLL